MSVGDRNEFEVSSDSPGAGDRSDTRPDKGPGRSGAGGPGPGGLTSLRESALRDSLLVGRIEGMHSHRCEDRIVTAVTALQGVREVEVDFPSGQTSVIFDAQRVAAHQIIDAIEKSGYAVSDYAMGSGGGVVE